MKLTNNAPRKNMAVKALNQLKKMISHYPTIAGIGLGRNKNNKFVVVVYVDNDGFPKTFSNKYKIPKLINVKDTKNGGKTVRIPTQIEEVDQAELLIAI